MSRKIEAAQAARLPIQHLAWVGDAVYELMVRQHFAVEGRQAPGEPAHKAAARLTSAVGQAAVVCRLLPEFSSAEQDLLKRGRNYKGSSRSTARYCQATGLEVVVGWLWLSGQDRRLDHLFSIILEEAEQ